MVDSVAKHHVMKVSIARKCFRSKLLPRVALYSSGGDVRADGNGQGAAVRFDNPEVVTRGKSTWEVFRGWLVFKLFTLDVLVDNSLKLYSLSKRVFGTWFTEKCLRATAFGQFAGGLHERGAEETICKLAKRNISSIWFFSIERDLDEVSVPASQAELETQERLFDEVNQRYLKSIEMSAVCNCDRPVRFAAVKWTAIVNPHLLNKLNRLLAASENTFLSLASPGEHTVDRAIPHETFKKAIPDVRLQGTSQNGSVGYADWSSHFSLGRDLQHFKNIKSIDDTLVSFTDTELEQYRRFIQRLVDIGECAKSAGVRVLIDAEQTYFQLAIEHLTLHLLSQRYNSPLPLIYNTLQTYLVNSYDRLQMYLDCVKRYRVKSGIKVVRGCYMEHERHRAKSQKENSPLHPTKLHTDESYHSALKRLMPEVSAGHAQVMVASHNKDTVRTALEMIREHRISSSDGSVAFGQLLGMGDHLTYPLASAGYIANKVVPYGPMDDIMPFLSRRGNENRGMMRNARDERVLYWQELKRRTLY